MDTNKIIFPSDEIFSIRASSFSAAGRVLLRSKIWIPPFLPHKNGRMRGHQRPKWQAASASDCSERVVINGVLVEKIFGNCTMGVLFCASFCTIVA